MTRPTHTEIIIALDVDSLSQSLEAVEACGECRWFKTGLQLFSRTGPAIVEHLKSRGKRVFLDLKLHDIPNTVARAARAAADLGADLITVHACGGRTMISAARNAVEGSGTRVLAVTVLTSIDDHTLRVEVGLHETAEQAVGRYARMAVESGAHGVVASPFEIRTVRSIVGGGPIIVTPGIRPPWAASDDQARFLTPREAAEAGADFIVVGRPVLKHERPSEAFDQIRKEITST